ncbi:ATP synthase subunit gamma, mitochondrial [Eurytemora carolleeae]|uniref:ATP synthase subunit gamma, mitochondrial n=1 Tax=Eurytemora carolleeae TaxID=1294199 RepID=UPI000C758A52|nr:ATP synthase subunit gamma, mitochondrial [Eurytemora carolleeae]|eukprot:XP_023321939.1 ATP synthase subunit gamma, mitochondrial-like [Eurytemora affinis]
MFSQTKQLVPVLNAQCQQQRGMANLKIIGMRLKSVRNIQKITQSMKMVSAAKFARAERDLRAARPLGSAAKSFYDHAEVSTNKEAPKELYVAMTSDRGLAGAVHSSINKAIRNELNEKASLENVKVICVGDKSRGFFQKFFPENILMVGSEIGRLPPQFGDASKVANAVLSSGFEFDSGKMFYNRYNSVVSYTTTEIPIFSQDSVANSAKITLYDSIDSDVLQSYIEYSLASLFYYVMKEGACSEQSSRMTAMDNSTKNAGEMIDKLQTTFNRTRQAVITGELIEIISGAAALD